MIRFYEKRKKKETTKDKRICRFSKLTKKESKRFNASNITEFENLVTTTKFSKTSERVSKIRETTLAIFFTHNNFFLWLIVNFFFLKLIFSKLRKIYICQWILLTSQRQQNQNQNNSSLLDRTQNRAHLVCFRKQKNWTYVQFSFSNKTNRESHHFDFSNYMCFESF